MKNEEEIEVLEEDFEEEPIEILEDDNTKKKNNIIELDRLFSLDNEEVVDVYEENKQKEERKQKIVTRVQIGLIVFLVVFASLFYFFGYNLVEPYIKID